MLCSNPTSCVCRVNALGKTVEAVLSSRKHPGLLKQLHDNVDSLQKSRCLSVDPTLYDWAAPVPACSWVIRLASVHSVVKPHGRCCRVETHCALKALACDAEWLYARHT